MALARLLIQGIACGLGAAVPIGPVNVEIARRSLRGGFFAGVALGAGAVTVDVIYMVLYAVGVARFTDYPWVYWPLAIAGVVMLTYVGTTSLLGARTAARGHLLDRSAAPSIGGGYVTGLVMTATNPMTLAFWFTVLPALAGTMTEHLARDLPMICTGVFLGAIGWVLVFSGLLSLAGRFRKSWWLTAADEIGGVMLLGLAGAALLRADDSYNGAQAGWERQGWSWRSHDEILDPHGNGAVGAGDGM
jgi:threonine/homoserine/homoserine lactone efflux protein